jgi:hypothetical protein
MALPEHFHDEWTEARSLIEKQDDRIHDTRKLVFGLFPTLLTAGSILGSKLDAPPRVWFGIQLTLLGLLLTGRYIEQQSYLLQIAAVSRTWALELLTPVELTETISDRFASGWPRRTTLIYAVLGLVSLFVTAYAANMVSTANWAMAIPTALYVVYIVCIGIKEIKYPRNGRDWSFSATSCAEGDHVSILLVNHWKKKTLSLDEASAELLQVFDNDGRVSAQNAEVVELRPPKVILDTKSLFPPRMACRWVWPAKPGVWTLKVGGNERACTRRFLHVRAKSCESEIPAKRMPV